VIWVFAVLIAAAVIVVAWVLVSRLPRTLAARSSAAEPGGAERLPAPLAEFHVRGEDALVYFEVPLPEGEIDEVLREVLVREAVEVVREKRHHLPIGDVHRVVAFGRRDGDWARVGDLGLDTPGELPPPTVPSVLPHHAAGFDPLDHAADLPESPPRLAERREREELPPLAEEIRMPARVEAGLRAQGIDPAAAGAGDVVLGIMRFAGYTVAAGPRPDTYAATRAGSRAYLRVVEHAPGDHPELDEEEVRRFHMEFVESGTDRGLLVTEKYSPFAVYERERRDPRIRYITRERLQYFIDALAVG
jgi:hypothetical protein